MPRKPKCEPWKNVVVIGEPSEELIRKVIRGFIEKPRMVLPKRD